MDITLIRHSYGPHETLGMLFLPGDIVLQTIERPWLPNSNGAPGGEPFRSCIPDGKYRLSPWVRPNGDEVYILRNAALGVYHHDHEHLADRGRHLCLIHAANYSDEVMGCIAPGKSFLIHQNRPMVTQSRSAMRTLRNVLGRVEPHTLFIQRTAGAVDVL